MGIGLDFGLQNGPTLTTPDDARRAYDQGQLIGSAVGMAADIVAIGAGLSILWSGELPALLGGLIGSVFGPEGTAGGALVGTVISVPALIAGLGLTSVGAGLLPGHTSLLDDAVDNLRRMEGAGGSAGGGGRGGATSRVLVRTQRQIQSKFRHARDFGVTGNYSRANATEFSRAIQRHINAPGTRRIAGTYRGNPVVHNVDPSTGLNVIEDMAGNFVSGWRLTPTQLRNVLMRGSL